MMMNLDAYFVSQALPRPRYAGQLEPDFQEALARRYAASDPSECLFAQTIELPDGTILHGGGDFRGSESAHLGDCSVAGKRVLEFGAGSGWLTSYLEEEGASVVSLDLPLGMEALTSPFANLTPSSELDSARAITERVRKSWWYVKRQAGFDAKMVYCDLEAPPDDLGRFDVSTLAAVLLRLPNPYMALSAAAARTDEAIVVTEPITIMSGEAATAAAVSTFAPEFGSESLRHWWHHSPGAISRMLLTLGFGKLDLKVHTTPRSGVALYTITARRTEA